MVTCVKPDERSVMTYVVAYYRAFANYNKVTHILMKCRHFNLLHV